MRSHMESRGGILANSLVYSLYILLALWLFLVAIAYLLRKRFKEIEVSLFSIMVKKRASFSFFEKLRGRKWFNAYLLFSIPVMLFSMLIFYYFVGTVAFHRVSGQGGGGLVPLIPGLTIRGTTLIYFLIIIGYSATIHELSHAAAAVHSGVKVKSTGFVLFFFIPAAFVEPDEEEFKKASLVDRAKILSAGPASNFYAGLIFFLIILSLTHGLVGAQIIQVEPGSPAEKYGLKPGMVILYINGSLVKNFNDVGKILSPYKHKNVTFNFTVRTPEGATKNILVRKPANRTLVGITLTTPKAIQGLSDKLYYPLMQFIVYSYIINISLAIINAAPLFISDGGRLVSDFFKEKIGGDKGRILNFFVQITTVLIVLFSLTLVPL
jgi:membrane-associated protease RseP (regulator of RpoE activity)